MLTARPTSTPLRTAPTVKAIIISTLPRGGTRISAIYPIILLIIKDDELLAKAF
ncbi:MAG: hypothetical protein Tsb006_1660 [Rickettsiaceae bacterium]